MFRESREGAEGPQSSRHGAEGMRRSREGGDGLRRSYEDAEGLLVSREGADGAQTMLANPMYPNIPSCISNVIRPPTRLYIRSLVATVSPARRLGIRLLPAPSPPLVHPCLPPSGQPVLKISRKSLENNGNE